MRNEVTVNGVKLTREQVEGALKELNDSVEPKPLKAGQWVRTEIGDPTTQGNVHGFPQRQLRIVVDEKTAQEYLEQQYIRGQQYTKHPWIVVFDPYEGFLTHARRSFYTPVDAPEGFR